MEQNKWGALKQNTIIRAHSFLFKSFHLICMSILDIAAQEEMLQATRRREIC